MKNRHMLPVVRFVLVLIAVAASVAWTSSAADRAQHTAPWDVRSGAADLGAGAAFEAPKHIRVLTYNVFTVLGAVGVRQRMALIGASDHMRGYDVIILNELFNDSASEHLLDLLSAEYPYLTPVLGRDSTADPACAGNDCWNSSEGGFVSGRPEDGGVAIVSKWPIQERRQYVFQATCDIDALSSKGFVYVRLDMNGKMVHVIGTHMEADPSDLGTLGAQMLAMYPCPDPGDVSPPPACPGQNQTPYEAMRLAQLMEMSAWIEQQNFPKEQMVLIGGDLNVDRVGNPAEYQRMLCILNVNEPAFGGNPEGVQPWYTYDSRLNGLLSPDITSLYVDYILLRRDHAAPSDWNNYVIQASSYPANWSGIRARGFELSDHFPVAGYVSAADAPSPVTTRVQRDRKERPGANSSVVYYGPCPPGFTPAERLCYRRAG